MQGNTRLRHQLAVCSPLTHTSQGKLRSHCAALATVRLATARLVLSMISLMLLGEGKRDPCFEGNVEPQPRFGKETLKRSVRVSKSRPEVDSLTRHVNERNKKV